MNATIPLRARNVLLCGYYGFGNTGDELILEALLSGLRERRPGLGVTVVTGDPEGTASRHDVAVVRWQDVPGIAAAVQAADLVLVGGGGLFQEYWEADLTTFMTERHGSMTFYAAPLVLAAVFGKPAAVIGVGVGPVVSEAGRRLLRAVGEAASVLSVRDRASRDALVEAGVSGEHVTVGADAVFGSSVPDPAARRTTGERAERLVGVSLRPWSFGVEQERWEDEVAAALDQIVAGGSVRLRFLPFHVSSRSHEDDVAVCRRVISRLHNGQGRCELLDAPGASASVGGLAGCDLVLGMRLHAVELALMLDIPVVGLGYDPKVLSVLDRVGLAELGIPVGAISAAAVAGKLERATAILDARRESVRAMCRELRDLAGKDLHAAADLLDRPSGAPRKPGPECMALAGLALRAQFESFGRLRSEHDRRFDELQRAYDVAREQGEVLGRTAEELKRTSAELVRTRESLAAAGKRAARLEEDLARSRAEAQRLGGQLLGARNELFAIHSSRLWRLGSHYWRLREIVLGGRDRSGGRARRDALPGPVPTPGWTHEPGGSVEAGPTDGALGGETTAPHDVLCLPIIDWDFRWQRPQQLMSRFAAAGHRVFYVAQRLRSDGPPYVLTEKAPRLFEVSLRGPALNVYGDALDGPAADEMIAALDALRRDVGLDAVAQVVQLPFWWPLARLARERWAWPVIYDCMDLHAGFSTNRPEMTAQEDDVLGGADTVVVSSSPLEVEARRRATRVTVVRNGCDFERFASVGAPPREAR
ncbi:MAG: polysaccharide pyruvyl transferase family protein, partial [Acidobacteriota bacterium]